MADWRLFEICGGEVAVVFADGVEALVTAADISNGELKLLELKLQASATSTATLASTLAFHASPVICVIRMGCYSG
jgi:hypothetical protein